MTTTSSTPATRRGVTEQAAAAAIDSATRVLRLPTIRSRFEEIAAAAQREQLTYLGFLVFSGAEDVHDGDVVAGHAGDATSPAGLGAGRG